MAVTRELSRLLPAELDTVVTTARLRSVSPEGITEYWTMLDYVLDQVAAADPAYVIQNTVIVSLTGDTDSPARLRDLIEARTGARAIVGPLAVAEALVEHKIRRPLVVMPYVQMIRDRMDAFLRAAGIVAANWAGPQLRSPGEIHRSNASTMRETIVAAVGAADDTCDGVLISGGGWSSLDLIAEVKDELAVPILSSNIAQAWKLQCLSGYPMKSW